METSCGACSWCNIGTRNTQERKIKDVGCSSKFPALILKFAFHSDSPETGGSPTNLVVLLGGILLLTDTCGWNLPGGVVDLPLGLLYLVIYTDTQRAPGRTKPPSPNGDQGPRRCTAQPRNGME